MRPRAPRTNDLGIGRARLARTLASRKLSGDMRRTLAIVVATFIAAMASCRDPTEITIVVTTDAKCSDLQGTSIAVGRLGDALEGKPPSSVSSQCDPTTGRIAELVVVPSGSSDDEVAFRITAGIGRAVSDCTPSVGPGCVVARRALHFIPHTPLYVPVHLTLSCSGVPCGPTSTCQNGRCVDSRIDGSQCTSPAGCELPDAGAPPVDGGAPPPPIDGGAPPPPADGGSVTAFPLATVGNVASETGFAQQQHIVYATHSARWWLFYVDDADASVLKTRWSEDFATWTAGNSLTLAEASGYEGRNFSVSYADLGGKDVVHIAFSHHATGDANAYHARATIDAAVITFSAPTLVATSAFIFSDAEPDGPVTTTASDGTAYLATGWINEKPFKGFDTVANMDVFASTSPDDGTSSGPLTSYVLHSWVPLFVHNRALVPVGAGQMLAVWSAADTSPDPSDLSWSISTAGWSTNASLFGAATPTSMNDWSVCAETPTRAHAVRRKVNGGANDAYEHFRFDTAQSRWSAGATIPSDLGVYGTGIVLLTSGSKLLLFALGADGATRVRATAWNGSTWSPWFTVVSAAAKRAFLSGSGCGSKTHAAITWTEGNAAPYRIVGADVSSLL
jgi:hypothetical protein